MLRLKHHLFDDYDGLVRPVHDGISPTIVTFRMVLYALLDMVCFQLNYLKFRQQEFLAEQSVITNPESFSDILNDIRNVISETKT